MPIPKQCLECVSFNLSDSLCRIYEQLPGEYGREDITDCPSFVGKGTKDGDDLKLLVQYMEEDAGQKVLEEKVSAVVSRILDNYESKYKILIVGIARRKIKSLIKMVDIIDTVLEKLSDPTLLEDMAPSQAIRLLSELNHSINNDLSFIMKLVDPSSKLDEMQTFIDKMSIHNTINIQNNVSDHKDTMSQLLNLSATSRERVRDVFDSLLYQAAIDNKVDVSKLDLDTVIEGDSKDEES